MAKPDRFLWATRGKHWGFRFLRDGGLSDPLPLYEQTFANIGDERDVCQRVGRNLALRFADPDGHQDDAGRAIPHSFVVFPPLSDEIHTLDDGLRLVWAPVAAEYARLWGSPAPLRRDA